MDLCYQIGTGRPLNLCSSTEVIVGLGKEEIAGTGKNTDDLPSCMVIAALFRALKYESSW